MFTNSGSRVSTFNFSVSTAQESYEIHVDLCPGQNFSKTWWSRFLVQQPGELKLSARLGMGQINRINCGNTATCLGWSSFGIPWAHGTERKRWFRHSVLNNSIFTLQDTHHQAQVIQAIFKSGSSRIFGKWEAISIPLWISQCYLLSEN